ncbi:hypothetical protein ACSBR1_000457 [Camellia fascicularis]
MEMEVLIPTTDFDFNSGRSSPCLLTAPSTPKRFGDCYFSAPTSPTCLSQFYRDFDDFCAQSTDFDWEEKPGTPKSIKPSEDNFAFDVSEEMEKMIVPAEELFHGGKIRPLTLPTQPWKSSSMSPRSPISRIRGAFSPRKKKEYNPFESAIGNTNSSHNRTEHERGRERVVSSQSQSTSHGRTRSLSPYRVSKYPWEEQEQGQEQQEQQQQQLQQNTKQSSNTSSSTLSFSSSKGSHRKWRLKDFFLFRSASEGRASDRDPLRKYAALFKKHEDANNSSSFRSMEGSTTRRKGTVSAHELHYKANRAVSEDLKKKTFLPYKQGILGRLAFNPTVHALANRFGFSRK